MNRVCIALILFIFALPAVAGDDVWDVRNLRPGSSSSITIATSSFPFATPILETRLCGSGALMTTDTDVTFDIQICGSDDASTCRTRQVPSPINASTDFGGEFPVTGAYLRLVIINDASTDATFTFSCHP